MNRTADGASAALPPRQPIRPDSERGRVLTIVTALASASGVTTSPLGKTAWFTLDASGDAIRSARQAEAEAGA